MELDTVVQADALTFLASLPDASVDAVITDPPYGIGIDEWDKPINIPEFLAHAYRLLKTDGWLAFTMQMPVMVDWLVVMRDTKFKFKDHIVWVKRKNTTTALDLNRSHESLFIYRKGAAKFYQTKGRYEDVKLPGLLTNTYTLDGLDRYIKDMHLKLTGVTPKAPGLGGGHHEVYQYMKYASDRSPRDVNFTNVWSFLPENSSQFKAKLAHATMKPLLMYKRLVGLLTAPHAIVLDPFAGSGTTLIAAQHERRHFVGCELNPAFVDLCNERLDEYWQPLLLEFA